jgi:hypothetical protein
VLRSNSVGKLRKWRVKVAGEGIEPKILIFRAPGVATKLIVLSHKINI